MRQGQVLMNIYRALLSRYGAQHWWPAETPFEVCVGAILVQNTNWNNVEKAIRNLRREGLLSFSALLAADDVLLKSLIRPAGFFNIKAGRLRAFLAFLAERCEGRIESLSGFPWPVIRAELLSVHGIGMETADSILLYALNKPVFVVDAYTRRLLNTQGFGEYTRDYGSMQTLFMENIPSDPVLYNEYHALIVALGKERGFSLGSGADVFYNTTI